MDDTCILCMYDRFSIPIKDFWTAGVWMKAGVFLACMSGKLAIGLLATPPTTDMMLTLAFAWGEWGEFSFIIATLAFDGGVIEKEYVVPSCLSTLGE